MSSAILLRGDFLIRSCPPCTKRRLSVQELIRYSSSSTQMCYESKLHRRATARLCSILPIFPSNVKEKFLFQVIIGTQLQIVKVNAAGGAGIRIVFF